MKILFKSSLGLSKIRKLAPCVSSIIETRPIQNLSSFSVPYQIRKSVFQASYLSLFHNNIVLDESKRMNVHFHNFSVYKSDDSFLIQMTHKDFTVLPVLIYYLLLGKPKFHLFLSCNFMIEDINFLRSLVEQFPDVKFHFELSELDFTYLEVQKVEGELLHVKTMCLRERIEDGLPNFYEKDIAFYSMKEKEVVPNLDLMKCYKVCSSNYGIISEASLFPRSLEEQTLIILP